MRTDVGKGKERVGRLCKLPHGSLCHGLGEGEIGKNLAMQLWLSVRDQSCAHCTRSEAGQLRGRRGELRERRWMSITIRHRAHRVVEKWCALYVQLFRQKPQGEKIGVILKRRVLLLRLSISLRISPTEEASDQRCESSTMAEK